MGKVRLEDSDDDDMPIEHAGTEPDVQLLADVREFAAQLGFGSTSDAAFDDFAPEKAQKKINDDPKNAAAQNGNKEPAPREIAKKKDDLKPTAAAAPTPLPQLAYDPLPEYKPGKDGAPPKSLLKNHHHNNQEEGRWYDIADALNAAGDGDEGGSTLAVGKSKKSKPATQSVIDEATLDQYAQRGQQLLAAEAAAFEASASRQKGDSNLQWLQQAQRGGTTADKVAAMAVLVQESPIANVRALDGLIAMVGKRGGARAVVGTALDALKELWMEVLLPHHRKLRFLQQRPLAAALPSGREGDKLLLFWSFEDALKRRYASFVEALDHLSRDNLEFVKDRASKTAFDLLKSCPEEEAALLSLLVNKLGDPSRKLASKVGYLLTTLLASHPGMKAIVVREVERFAFRPGLADKARYYAVVFLNQIVLTHKDAPVVLLSATDGSSGDGKKTQNNNNKNTKNAAAAPMSLARRLIDVYFTLFKLVMEGKVGTASTLAAAKVEKEKRIAQEKAARRGKKKLSAKTTTGQEQHTKADGTNDDDDELENKPQQQHQHQGEMDARMLSALITGVRRAFPFVSAEEVEPLIEAHADALFQLAHRRSVGVATQSLLLLHQLMASRNSVSDRFYRALYAVLLNPELIYSTKGPMFLSLLFKSIKADINTKRIFAFLKRLLQLAAEAPSNFTCGCLLLTSEVLKAKPGLWNGVLQPEDTDEDKSGGGRGKGVEKFVDLDKEIPVDEEKQQGEVEPTTHTYQHQWPEPSSHGYDMRKREPQYSNAERSCFWELVPLASHAHPSVAAMARTLLAGTHISYDGDPLRDLTLHSFLDKFIQKKPKTAGAGGGEGGVEGARGASLMQPLPLRKLSASTHGVATTTSGDNADGPDGLSAPPVVLRELDAKDVAPDDAFFYKFYALQAQGVGAKKKKEKKKKRGGDDDDEEALVSDGEDGGDSDDSDAIDDFLDGEDGEGGGDGDDDDDDAYKQLAAAMMDEDDDDDESESEHGEDVSEVSEQEEEVEVEVEEEESEEEEESDGEGEEAEDEEVRALMAALQRKKKNRKEGDDDSSEMEELNPFDLAEASDDNDSEEEEEEDDDDEDDMFSLDEEDMITSEEEEEEDQKTMKNNKKKKSESVFAAADEYDDLIHRDLEGGVEETEADTAKEKAGIRVARKRRGGGQQRNSDVKRSRRRPNA